jgi:F420-dependent methylenetetrahydromethanopterin dehydrogenase
MLDASVSLVRESSVAVKELSDALQKLRRQELEEFGAGYVVLHRSDVLGGAVNSITRQLIFLVILS